MFFRSAVAAAKSWCHFVTTYRSRLVVASSGGAAATVLLAFARGRRWGEKVTDVNAQNLSHVVKPLVGQALTPPFQADDHASAESGLKGQCFLSQSHGLRGVRGCGSQPDSFAPPM